MNWLLAVLVFVLAAEALSVDALTSSMAPNDVSSTSQRNSEEPSNHGLIATDDATSSPLAPGKSTSSTRHHPKNLTKTSSTDVLCARKQYKCSLRDKVYSPQFAKELFNGTSTSPIPPERVEYSIVLTATRVNDAARFFHEAKLWKEKADKSKNQLTYAKARYNYANVELMGEEAKAEAAALARGLMIEQLPEEKVARMDKMTRSVMRVWFTARAAYPVGDALEIMKRIDPTKMLPDDDIYAMGRSKITIENSCTQQMMQIMFEDNLKIGSVLSDNSLLQQLNATAFKENELSAAKLAGELRRMATGRNVEEIEEQLANLGESLDVC